MKILQLSATDTSGGGPIAAFRLNIGLNKVGIESNLVVQKKLSDDNSVIGPETKFAKLISIINPTLDQLILKTYPRKLQYLFSPGIFSNSITKTINILKPDIVNLHWVGFGFFRVETINSISKPLIWTLHDSWTFTGGCHLPFECKLYHHACGTCPALGSVLQHDLSRWVWYRKSKAYRKSPLTIITPSHWMANNAKRSSLLHDKMIRVIPNGLDINKFKPIDKQLSRKILGLQPHCKYILFGAVSSTTDPNKGFKLLAAAMAELCQLKVSSNVELLVLGASEPKEHTNFNFKVHYMGRMHDEVAIAVLYSAADVFVAPSLQENLPYTVMEALSCGTPCVAFDIGGMPELIEHGRNGFLAQPFEPDSLVEGITWVLEDKERWHLLSHRARQKVENEFALEAIARRYADMYKEILENNSKK